MEFCALASEYLRKSLGCAVDAQRLENAVCKPERDFRIGFAPNLLIVPN